MNEDANNSINDSEEQVMIVHTCRNCHSVFVVDRQYCPKCGADAFAVWRPSPANSIPPVELPRADRCLSDSQAKDILLGILLSLFGVCCYGIGLIACLFVAAVCRKPYPYFATGIVIPAILIGIAVYLANR